MRRRILGNRRSYAGFYPAIGETINSVLLEQLHTVDGDSRICSINYRELSDTISIIML